MLSKLRSSVSYANVTATLALFVALSGGAYAALTLPPNSVGRRQLKPDAVNSAKVEDRSLRARDFRAGQLPAGAQGPEGPQGPTGDKGDKGDKGDTGAQGPGAVAMNTRIPNANSDNTTTLFTLGELTVKGSCWNDSSGGGGQGAAKVRKLTVHTSTDAIVNWVWADGQQIVHSGGDVLLAAGDLVVADSDRAEGEFIYRNANRVISVQFHVFWGAPNPCEYFGTAVPAV